MTEEKCALVEIISVGGKKEIKTCNTDRMKRAINVIK